MISSPSPPQSRSLLFDPVSPPPSLSANLIAMMSSLKAQAVEIDSAIMGLCFGRRIYQVIDAVLGFLGNLRLPPE